MSSVGSLGEQGEDSTQLLSVISVSVCEEFDASRSHQQDENPFT